MPKPATPAVISGPVVQAQTITADTTLEQIMASPQLFERLLRHTQKEFSSENPKFLMSVRHFRSLTSHQVLNLPIAAVRVGAWIPPEARGTASGMGKYIYDRYIGEAAEAALNLPGAVFENLSRIAGAPGTPFTRQSFDAAYEDIGRLMLKDSRKRLVAAGG